MKPAFVVLLLAPALAFGQQFQDVSQKGSPVSLSIGFYPGDPNPAVFARNDATKGVLAIVVAANFKGTTGQEQDYAFKLGPLKSHDQRGVAPVDIPNFKTVVTGPNSVTVIDDHPDPAKLKQATGDGAVLLCSLMRELRGETPPQLDAFSTPGLSDSPI